MQQHWKHTHVEDPTKIQKKMMQHFGEVLTLHAKQQRVTDVKQIVGIFCKVSALETNRKQFSFVDPNSASSQTSARQTLHIAKSVETCSVSTRSCGSDADFQRIAILSLVHREQFLAAKVLTTLIGLPCQMMLQIEKTN